MEAATATIALADADHDGLRAAGPSACPTVAPPPGPVELSIVMPCLNEADTVAVCVTKATRAMAEAGIAGEVIVADNGSTDGSQAIAEGLGARVVPVPAKGYGSALMGGIAAARGEYVLMGDADDSYDFLDAPRFLSKLREGYDLVQGCRLPAGGGTVRQGAMPFLHRWVGNPGLTMLVRWWFRAPINDVYCGMRGFRKDWYDGLRQRCTGMEFATEMIIKASRYDARIAEVPITLHPDGRKAHAPHLKTFRDGWRTLRFFLMYAPRWLFLEPGKLLVLLGLIGYALALPGLTVAGVHFGLNTLLMASMAILCGCQAIMFAIGAKAFAAREGLVPEDTRIHRFYRHFTLERGLMLSGGAVLAGAALLAVAVFQWWSVRFGDLNYDRTSRWVIAGVTLTTWGVQTLFSSFFITILGTPRR